MLWVCFCEYSQIYFHLYIIVGGSTLWQWVSVRLTSATNVLLANAEKCLPSNYRLCHWSRMSHVPAIVAPGNASAAEWQRREASVRRLHVTGTRVLREGKPLQKTTGPPGWGLDVGPTTPPRKNYQVTETATMNSNLRKFQAKLQSLAVWQLLLGTHHGKLWAQGGVFLGPNRWTFVVVVVDTTCNMERPHNV